MKTIRALVIRTEMCGGGTGYDVYWRTKDKPSHPLHNDHIYATTIHHGNGQYYFRTTDAIDPKTHWAMDPGGEKYDQFKRLEKVARRLELRVARRAFPELASVKRLPMVCAPWTLKSAEVWVAVKMELPV